MNRKIILGALSVIGALGIAAPAHADPPAGSGWDKNPDVVVGGGSDTTYLVSQRLEALYNGAPGCAIVTTTSGNPNKGKCTDTSAAPTGVTNGNYDHDVLVSAAPTGSGAGVDALLPTGTQYNPAIDYARSSRGNSGNEKNDVTFWGYARDGIAVITFGSRSGLSLSKQDLIDIYTCTKTNWSQFGQPAGTIIPWEMNSASGTRSTFLAYLGIGGTGQPPVGACARKLESGIAAFENDVKPLLADRGPDGTYGTADDDENNYIWWISYGNWITYPYTKNGLVNGTGAPINSNLVTVEGKVPGEGNILDSTYTIMRTLYHVTREADADCNTVVGTEGVCNNAANTVYGTTSGKGGAVREFTQWLCRTSNATHAVNPVTGAGYRSEIVRAINAEGFQQVSATVTGLRTPGYACSVTN